MRRQNERTALRQAQGERVRFRARCSMLLPPAEREISRPRLSPAIAAHCEPFLSHQSEPLHPATFLLLPSRCLLPLLLFGRPPSHPGVLICVLFCIIVSFLFFLFFLRFFILKLFFF